MTNASTNEPRVHPLDRRHFSSPRQVVDSSSLTRERKRSILLEWLQDERALAVAEDEGMEGGQAPEAGPVLHALRALRN